MKVDLRKILATKNLMLKRTKNMNRWEKIQRRKFWIIRFLAFTFILFLSGRALAVPALGVATDTGMYLYSDDNGIPDPDGEEYIYYYADTFLPGGENEGFVIGGSGSNLIVFTSYDPSVTQIYLMADTGGAHVPMSFGGDFLTLDNLDPSSRFVVGQADGYKDMPYAYLALEGSLFAEVPGFPGTNVNKKVYSYTAPFIYEDQPWTLGYYMWAAAEINGEAELQFKKPNTNNYDKFSPKTSSAGGLPEPSTVVLLGLGLIGLFGFSRKKFKK